MAFTKNNKFFYETFGLPKNTLRKETYNILSSKFKSGKGRDKKADKETGTMKNYIYSENSYKGYRQQMYKFCNWLKSEFPEVTNINKIKKYHINKYLETLIKNDLSPWSISLAKSAICKTTNISSFELMETPSRERREIMRSRLGVKQDSHISKAKEEFCARITSATGLRRAEMERIIGYDLEFNAKDNEYYITVTKGTKGGRPRKAIIVGENKEDTEYIVNLFKDAQDRLVVPKLPKNYDNHFYRGQYAKRVYTKYARPIKDIPGGKDGDQYIMRKDRAGVILDKKAMKLTSESLGHSRINVIAQSYLY